MLHNAKNHMVTLHWSYSESENISVSGHCMHFIFKICQVVIGISMISQFHEFFNFTFSALCTGAIAKVRKLPHHFSAAECVLHRICFDINHLFDHNNVSKSLHKMLKGHQKHSHILSKGLGKDLLRYGRNTSHNLILWNYNLERSNLLVDFLDHESFIILKNSYQDLSKEGSNLILNPLKVLTN